MGDEPYKPPRRAKSATERDLEGLRAREEREHRARTHAPALGVPILEADPHDDFTPVADVLDQIADPETKRIVALLWRHTANIELRAQARLAASDGGALRRDLSILQDELAELRTDIVDVRGESGSGGALGELTRQVNGWASRRWWLLTFVAGTIVTVLGAAIVFGRWMGRIETDVDTLKARAAARRAAPEPFQLPAEVPAKDAP